MAIKQILFDCGGVFVELRYRELITELTGDAQMGDFFWERLFAEGSPWSLYDQGLISAEEERARLGGWFPELHPTVLDRFMEDWLRCLIPYPEMEGLVDALHAAGLKCYLLSNFPDRFGEFEANVPMLWSLDGKLISYEVKLLKPGREIFDLAAARFHIRPEETLFIDDSFPNVTGARAAGYEAYLNVNPEALITYLRVRGLLK